MNPKLTATLAWLCRRADDVIVALLSTMFLAFLLQIASRYVFNLPVIWTHEYSALAWLWVVLWGSAFVLRESEEIRFDIVYGLVPSGVRRVFTAIASGAAVFLYAVSLPAAYSYVAFMKVERAPNLKIPFNWLFSIYVIFAVASIGRYAWQTWRALRGEAPPATDPATSGIES
ncbi:MAG: TRAP transporter small permease [Proteobacteria bacterium]|nr:TRAP transporter small permease [Pseudomonadota bacterium]